MTNRDAVAKGLAPRVLIAFSCTVGMLLLAVSHAPLILAHGSDAAVWVARPSWMGQAASVVLFIASSVAGLFRRRPSLAAWLVQGFLGWAFLFLGMHAIVVDRKSDTLRDVWGPFTLHEYRLPTEGASRPLFVGESRWLLRVDDGSREPGWLFLGIGPWRIDPTEIGT